jgi:hypothetical protein
MLPRKCTRLRRNTVVDILELAAVIVCIAFSAVAFATSAKSEVLEDQTSIRSSRRLLALTACDDQHVFHSTLDLNSYMRETGSGTCCREDSAGRRFYVNFERFGSVQTATKLVDPPPNYSAVAAYDWISKSTSTSSAYSSPQRESIKTFLLPALAENDLAKIIANPPAGSERTAGGYGDDSSNSSWGENVEERSGGAGAVEAHVMEKEEQEEQEQGAPSTTIEVADDDDMIANKV